MQSPICSGEAVSSLPLSIICLMASPAKQCIIYVSSMALFRLSAGMKMCNFLRAEIMSSTSASSHLFFSNISKLTFCHRTACWWFSRGEDTHKDKSNKKLLSACDSHSNNFKRWEQLLHLWLECVLTGSGAQMVQTHPPPCGVDCISCLCSLPEKAVI